MRSLTIFSTILFFCIGSLIAQEKTTGNSIFGAREPIPQTDQSVTRTKSASATVIPESPAETSTLLLSEGFDDITSLPGWMMINNSEPLGLTNYFQGSSTVFPAYDGDPDAYIGANFNNTSGAGTISNWLISPVLVMKDGDIISFYTRTATGSNWPDRLQLRLSLSGVSTDVGATAFSTGDFITLLLEVNPLLTVGGYPEIWTQYSATLSGIPVPLSGRLALRYFVTNGGPSGNNSNYIGIDRVVYASVGESGDEPVNIPVGNQAILLGVILMITFAVFRFRKML